MGGTSSREKRPRALFHKDMSDKEFHKIASRAFDCAESGEDLEYLQAYLEGLESLEAGSASQERLIDMKINGQTLLQRAVVNGHVTALVMILAHKPKLNELSSEGESALHMAVRRLIGCEPSEGLDNAEQVLTLLLAQDGIDVNLRGGKSQNFTAFEYLFHLEDISPEGMIRFFRILIESGAEFNLDGTKHTPLFMLVKLINEEADEQKKAQFIEVAQTLISSGYPSDMAATKYASIKGLTELSKLIKGIRLEIEDKIATIPQPSKPEVAAVFEEWKPSDQYDSLLKMRAQSLLATSSYFLCPLTGKIMQNPVITSVGVSYEAAAISERIGEGIDPLTGKRSNAKLMRNFALQAAINDGCKVTILACLELAQLKPENEDVVRLLLERARELNEVIKDSVLAEKISSFSTAEAQPKKTMTVLEWIEKRFTEILEEKDKMIYRDPISLNLVMEPVINSEEQTYSYVSGIALPKDPMTGKEVVKAPVTRVLLIPNCNMSVMIKELRQNFYTAIKYATSYATEDLAKDESIPTERKMDFYKFLRTAIKAVGEELILTGSLAASDSKLSALESAMAGEVSEVKPTSSRKLAVAAAQHNHAA